MLEQVITSVDDCFVTKTRTFERIKGILGENIKMGTAGIYWKFKPSETK
jgi:hypothetical protein